MSTDREDGPTKHYRYVCDGKGCKKRSKRGVDEPPDLPKGWVEYNPDEDNCPPGWKEEDGYDPTHFCPKCAGTVVDNTPKEILTKTGEKFDVSDHDSVYRPVIRQDAHTLVIDMKEAGKLVIKSNTSIKVEMHDA